MASKSTYQRIETALTDINRKNTASAPAPPAYSSDLDHNALAAPVERQPTMVTVNSSNAVPPSMPIIPQPVGPNTTTMTCPQCRCRVQTRISHRPTIKTHIACLLLTWTFCCCCLPYCMDTCRNTNHSCPKCGAFLGTYAS